MALSFDDKPKAAEPRVEEQAQLGTDHDLGSLTSFVLPALTPSWIYEPKREINEVTSTYDSETFIRVAGAEVAVADYQLLRRDFPALEQMSDREVDSWLIEQVAYISQMQAAPNDANTEIPVLTDGTGAPVERVAFRPYEPHFYGRASIAPVEGGLIDVKGTGSFMIPSQGEKLSGLMSLAEGLREYAMEKAVSMAAMKTGLDPAEGAEPFKTVGSYAVIKLPFNIKYPDGTEAPACLYLRQAHDRSKPDEFPQEKQLGLENTLRQFGVTASEYRTEGDSAYGGGELGAHDVMNIQVTRICPDGQVALYDYGSVRVRSDLDRKVMGDDGPVPAEAVRSQPVAELAFPTEIWSGNPNPLFDNLSGRFHHLGVALASGEIGRTQVESNVSELLDSVREKLWPGSTTLT